MSADADLRAKLLQAKLAQDAIAERERQEELAAAEPAIRAALERQIAEQRARWQAEYAAALENARTVLAVAGPEHQAWLAALEDHLTAIDALLDRLPQMQAPVRAAAERVQLVVGRGDAARFDKLWRDVGGYSDALFLLDATPRVGRDWREVIERRVRGKGVLTRQSFAGRIRMLN